MSSLLERGRRGEPLTGLDVVDMHAHLGRTDFTVPDVSAESLVAAMDRVGVTCAVCSHIQCLTALKGNGNDAILAAMRAFPGRILGYVRLTPSSSQDVQAETERRLGQGFTGLKLHNANGFPYTEPAYEPALAMADERRLPVVLHTWGEAECFDQVRTLAPKYAGATFLLAHAGSAGEAAYVDIANEFENVYLDLCLSRGPRGLVDRLARDVGVEKLVWGSDAIFINMSQQIGKVLGSRLSDGDKTAVLSGNARRILGGIQQ
jgi:hypothetical protein